MGYQALIDSSMENVRGARGRKAGGDSSNQPSFEEIVPSSVWSEDEKCHYLIVDLPGFKRMEVKLQVNYETNDLMVSGGRQVSELKGIGFQQKFKLPKNSNIEKITGKFESEILYVIIPKLKEEQKEEPKEENGTSRTVAKDSLNEKPSKGDDDKQGGGHAQTVENLDGERKKQSERVDEVHEQKLGHDASLLESMISKLRKNKGTVMTAILAFSLGVFITRKFESGGE